MTHPFKTAVEEFDAAYHRLRAHLLHALGVDEHQLAHDTVVAAKPLEAEVQQDAVNLAEQALTGAPAKPAATDETTTVSAPPPGPGPASDVEASSQPTA